MLWCVIHFFHIAYALKAAFLVAMRISTGSESLDISFDKNYNVCVFPPEQLKQAENCTKKNDKFLAIELNAITPYYCMG
jgi:hypothetical protein